MARRGDERHRGLVAVLGLSRHKTDRLVEQFAAALLLLARRVPVNLDLLVGQDPRAELVDDGPVDPHPSLGDPLVGLAPRAEAELGHALRQAQGLRRTGVLRLVAHSAITRLRPPRFAAYRRWSASFSKSPIAAAPSASARPMLIVTGIPSCNEA